MQVSAFRDDTCMSENAKKKETNRESIQAGWLMDVAYCRVSDSGMI